MIATVLFCLYAQNVSAFVGTATSGGGGAYVKRESSDTSPVIASILVDIWEARNVAYEWPKGVGTLHIEDDAGHSTPDDLVLKALHKLALADEALAGQVRADYEYVRNNVRVIPSDMRIEVPEDLKTPYYPVGHRTEGMMRFDGLTGKLDIDGEIFGRLIGAKHVAGAWLHEAVYKSMRDSVAAHTTSVPTRHLNACMLSEDDSCLPVAQMQLPQDRWVYECNADSVAFWVYPHSDTEPYFPAGYCVQFSHFGGRLGLDAIQEIASSQILFNPDGSMTGASSGRLLTALSSYSYAPGTAVIELKLGVQGEFLGATVRSARSSLRGGFDLLKNGSEAARCKLFQGGN